jgi:hypothetical protein
MTEDEETELVSLLLELDDLALRRAFAHAFGMLAHRQGWEIAEAVAARIHGALRASIAREMA